MLFEKRTKHLLTLRNGSSSSSLCGIQYLLYLTQREEHLPVSTSLTAHLLLCVCLSDLELTAEMKVCMPFQMMRLLNLYGQMLHD